MLRPPLQADIPAQVSDFFAGATVAAGYREPGEPVALNLIVFIGDRAPVGCPSYAYDSRDALRRQRVAKQQFEHVRKSLRIDDHDKRLGVRAELGQLCGQPLCIRRRACAAESRQIMDDES